jgi:hypothetical protein
VASRTPVGSCRATSLSCRCLDTAT